MAGACKITPTIKVGNEEKDSKLFKDIQKIVKDRNATKVIWGLTRVPKFSSFLEGLEVDENGEVLVTELSKVLDFNSIKKGSDTLYLDKVEIGSIDKKGNPIYEKTYPNLYKKAEDFNLKNTEKVAEVVKTSDGYRILLHHKTLDKASIPRRVSFTNKLNKKLLDITRSLGFDVKIDSKATYDGIFDPTNVEHTLDGLKTIIRIQEGQVGEEAFPEEFSHMIIAGLKGHPLVERLLNSLNNEELVERILGDEYLEYKRKYKGNFDLLKEEAAGKLLYKHITKQESKVENRIIPRIWNYIKKLFSSLSENDLNKAYREANENFSELASSVLNKSILPFVSEDLILKSKPLYKLSKRLDSLKEINEEGLTLASKRLKILQSRKAKFEYSKEDIKFIKDLQEKIENKQYVGGCLDFLKDTLKQVNNAFASIKRYSNDIESSDLQDLKKLATALRNVKEFSEGYSPLIKQLKSIVFMQEEGTIDISREDAEKIREAAFAVDGVLNNLETIYDKLRYNLVFNFLKQFWGEDKVLKIGKDKGVTLTLESIMEQAASDIGVIDTYINSLSECKDPMLALIDSVVKKTKAKRDNILRGFITDIRAAHNKLRKAGYDTKFMYEFDEEGKPTGRLLSEYDFVRYYKERNEYIDKITQAKADELGIDVEEVDSFLLNEALEKWEKKHTKNVTIVAYRDSIGNLVEVKEKVPIYKTNALNSLSTEQREYYDLMIKHKAMMENLLPKNQQMRLYNAVQIRDNIMTNLATSNNINSTLKSIYGNIKDGFVKRVDDTDLENSVNVVTDFSGLPIKTIPIYYTRRLEDMSRLSLDFTSSIMAYTGMAINYNEMNNVVDLLEITKDYVNDREVLQTKGNKVMKEAFTILRRKFSKAYSKRGELTNISKRLENYYDVALYQQQKKDEANYTIFGHEISGAKIADTIKSYTGILGLGLNVFSGIGNIVAGKIQQIIEVGGAEYYGVKDLANAERTYFALLPEFLAELNSPKKSSKLYLILEHYDAAEDFISALKEQGGHLGDATRLSNTINLYMLQNMGEHYLHALPLLAMVFNKKVLLDGREVSLYDAYETKKIEDKRGGKLAGELVLKKGVTNLDGSTYKEDEDIDFKMAAQNVNRKLNGAFNTDDKGTIQRYAAGRIVMQFRQWMVQHYNRRFQGNRYDFLSKEETEGYYRSFGKYLYGIMKDARSLEWHAVRNFNNLSSKEKANIRRAFTEIAIFGGLSLLINFMGPAKDKRNRWLESFALLVALRAKLEVGASLPSPAMAKSIMTMMNSPAACIRTVDSIVNLLNLPNIFVEIESGRFKGTSKYMRDLRNLIPVYSKIDNAYYLDKENRMFQLYNKN